MTAPRGLPVVALAVLLAGAVFASWGDAAQGSAAAGAGTIEGAGPGVGIDEHLGATVPLDTAFTAEDGSTVTLRQIVHGPTLLALVYYRCPNACDYLLTGMAAAFKDVPAVGGTDYQAITISIDDRETPADAQKARRIGLESIMQPFPADAWRFLTGSAASITAVAQAVGFRYVRKGDEFDHPLGMVVLSPQGKIVRYMSGAEFLPLDLKMAIMEASTGTVGPTIARVLRACLSYDPQSHRFVFRTLRVTATVTLTLAAVFVLYLVLSGRKRRAARR